MKPLCERCDAEIEGQPDQDRVASNVISVPFSDREQRLAAYMFCKGIPTLEIAWVMKRGHTAVKQILARSKYLPKLGPRKRGA